MLHHFFDNAVRRLNQCAGALAGLLIVYMTAHILVEIVMRFFSHSTYVLDEFIGYAVSTMTFLGLGYAMERGSLIRVKLLTNRLPTAWASRFDLATSLLSLAAFSFLAWYWGLNVIRSFQRHTVSQTMAETPLWIPEGMVLVGMVIVCLTLLARTLRLLTHQDPEVIGPSELFSETLTATESKGAFNG